MVDRMTGQKHQLTLHACLHGAVMAHAKFTLTWPFKPTTKSVHGRFQRIPCRPPVCLKGQVPVTILVIEQTASARGGCQQRTVVIDNVPDMLADNVLVSGTKTPPIQSTRHLVKQLDKLTDRVGIFFDDPVQGLSLIHISEPTRRTPISYAVFCLKK